MKQPTLLQIIEAYITLCIPAAMLSRVVRFITRRKNTPLDKMLMGYYYSTEKRILGGKDD